MLALILCNNYTMKSLYSGHTWDILDAIHVHLHYIAY